ncbi:MAG: type II toxin-antitoxin system HipA family toxin [Chthoniobacterales bacterium]
MAALAYGAAEIQRGTVSEVLPQLAQGGTAGGAYPKALVLLYDDGTLRASKPDGEGVPYLLKFDLSQENENAPCEHVYAIMAQAAGIKSVETTLIAESKTTARRHLLIKRFDIPDQKNPQRRLHFHSASGLLHKAPADLDYRDLFRVAIRLNVNPLELMEIARRMVFNVLGSNHDDHGKNHAFLYDEDQKTWSLTPAFDLNYTTGILERGMLVSGEVWPSFKTMEALCIDAGMTKKEFKKIFEEVDAAITQWPRFAKQAGVSSSMAQEIKERHRRIRNEVIRDY